MRVPRTCPEPRRSRTALWGKAVGVFDAHLSRFHLENSPGRRPQLEDVTRKAFYCEVLVDGADLDARRFERTS